MKAIEENIPPAQRAQYAEYRKAVDDRRKQRGMQPMPYGR